MKISMFIGGLTGGGAERVLCNLANYLDNHGHDVSMIAMSETKEQYELNQNVKVTYLLNLKERKNKFNGLFKRIHRLKKCLKTSDAEAYVVFLPVTIAFMLFFRRLIKAPVVASERCDPAVYSKSEKFLMKHYGKRADLWVFQTEDAAKWYESIAKKSVVIPNAINPAFIREPYLEVKEKSIVAAGRLCEQKNFTLLIEAFSQVSDEFSDYKLKIYGKGPLESQLKELVDNKGLSDRVEFMGYVDNMPEQLEKASLFVLSSDFEGMPNALMEAMALGLPCVSTDCPCGGPKFLIKDRENGLLVPVNDVEAMSSAIKEMLANEELQNTCSNNARNIVETLRPEVIYSHWEEVIEEAVREWES